MAMLPVSLSGDGGNRTRVRRNRSKVVVQALLTNLSRQGDPGQREPLPTSRCRVSPVLAGPIGVGSASPHRTCRQHHGRRRTPQAGVVTRYGDQSTCATWLGSDRHCWRSHLWECKCRLNVVLGTYCAFAPLICERRSTLGLPPETSLPRRSLSSPGRYYCTTEARI